MAKFQRCVALLMIAIWSLTLHGQTGHSLLRKGDKAYTSGEFNLAEDLYRKALDKENSTKGSFNLGNSIYRQQRFDEAAQHFENTAAAAKDNLIKSKSFHNLGNSHYQKKEFDKSVEAYKNALRFNPNDFDTKKNLALAKEKLKQQQQQQEKEQQQQQNQKQEGQKNQQQNQQSQNQKQQQQEQNQQENQSREPEKDLNKKEASQLLEIMNIEEQKVQQKLKKAQSKPIKSGKDW
jgi:tetratricopeptide (TPR) repeat protein